MIRQAPVARDRELEIPVQVGEISPGYQPYQKVVRPRRDLMLPDALLKWYDIARDGVDLEPLAREARTFLEKEQRAGRLRLQARLGFLELHHCASVAFLIVFTWNNDNEMWQSAWVKDLERDEPFTRVTTEQHGHRPSLCVWELAPVCHEREAWARYLGSDRGIDAKRAWLADRYAGPC